MKKRILSLICALAFCLTLLPSSALALNEKYLALGDSISTGYAPNGKVDNPFANQVADNFGYELTNKAEDGETTETLKGKLNSLSSEISDADLITITIGGNDVMNALYEYLMVKYNDGKPTEQQISIDDVKQNLMSGDIIFLGFASGVISNFAKSPQATTALNTFNTNLGEILSTIKSANSDVDILVTTQYNPYSYLAKDLASNQLFKDTANTISNAFNAGVKALNDVINTKKQDCNVVDVYKIFDDAVATNVNPCNPSVNMGIPPVLNLDFHPNQKGHDLIAQAIIDDLTNKVIPVTGVELNQKTLSLTVGNSANLTYIITPDTATYKTVTWESSNNEVAKADENGTVKAVGVGTAIITVKTTDGGFTDTCTITVTKSSSGSSSSGGSSSGSSSSSGNKTETTTNPDGSTTTTITKPDGSKTETTKYQDGSQEVVKTDKDGTVTTINTDKNGNKTEVIENTDGSSVTTVTNKDGSGSKTTIDTTGKVKTQVTITENNTTLPMPAVYATSSTNTAPVITVNMPSTSKVEIPTKNADINTVVVLVKSDGTEQIIKNSVTTKNGVFVTLNDGDIVKIIDNGKDFTDVTNNFWGADAIDFVTSREIFNGTSDTSFSPNTAMTRAMIVTVLARLNGVNTSTGDTWYEAGQKWAIENSISDGSNMNESLTREQLATMLYRYCKNPATSGDISTFTDNESVSSWAVYSMKWAVENGLISGMGDNTLNPQGEATRAQVATILMRFIENSI